MTVTATQYLFKASIPTSTTTATVGAYTVPAATRFQIVALTLTNTATTQVTAYADVACFDGTTAYSIGRAMPLYPGGNLKVQAVSKHVLPTGGAVYVTAYSTFVTAVMTGFELT